MFRHWKKIVLWLQCELSWSNFTKIEVGTLWFEFCSEMRSDSKNCFAFVIDEISLLRHTIKISTHRHGCSLDTMRLFIARDQSDLPFDHISHVVISVSYLLRAILKIKRIWKNLGEFEINRISEHLSCLIWEQLQQWKIQDGSANNTFPLKIIAPFRWPFAGEFWSSKKKQATVASWNR